MPNDVLEWEMYYTWRWCHLLYLNGSHREFQKKLIILNKRWAQYDGFVHPCALV